MFKRKSNQDKEKSKDSEILQKSQLDQLKSAFLDISLSSKDSSRSQDFDMDKVEESNRESPLIKFYYRVKNTFYDLNSRSFDKYSLFASSLNIKKIIQDRRELTNINIAVNSIEILTVLMCMFVPRKFVNKALLTLAMLTVQMQIVQKFMLNYYVEQIALHNNRMTPVEQQARNLIEYKYRISKFDPNQSRQQEEEPYVKKLLEEVDKKNYEYMKFKKVELLL